MVQPQLPPEVSAGSGLDSKANARQGSSSSTTLNQSQRSRSHRSHSSAQHLRFYPPSKRSSFPLDNGTGSSRTHGRPEQDDPYIFYRMCKSLFEPPDTSSQCHKAQSDLSSSETLKTSDIGREGCPSSPALKPVTIDWTLPRTRCRQHLGTKAATRGFRGFWRRVTPQRIRKHDGLIFHHSDAGSDEVASDAASVRKYRINVEADPQDDSAEGFGNDGMSTCKRRICGWSRYAQSECASVIGTESLSSGQP